MVVPTAGGTSDGAMADFQPLFDAVARDTGVTFKLSVGTSYISVVEAMAAGKALREAGVESPDVSQKKKNAGECYEGLYACSVQ